MVCSTWRFSFPDVKPLFFQKICNSIPELLSGKKWKVADITQQNMLPSDETCMSEMQEKKENSVTKIPWPL